MLLVFNTIILKIMKLDYIFYQNIDLKKLKSKKKKRKYNTFINIDIEPKEINKIYRCKCNNCNKLIYKNNKLFCDLDCQSTYLINRIEKNRN